MYSYKIVLDINFALRQVINPCKSSKKPQIDKAFVFGEKVKFLKFNYISTAYPADIKMSA